MPGPPKSRTATPRGAATRVATKGAAKRAAFKGAATGRATQPTLALPGALVPVKSLAWFRPLAAAVKLATGTPAPDLQRVPVAEANRLLQGTIHLVADVDAGSPRTVVWTRGASELLVNLAGVRLACASGLVTVTVPVTCDQLQRPAAVAVAFAVGTANRPAGLVMSTVDRLAGPEIVVAGWSEAITAFAWEALVHLARQLSAAVGKDANGQVLVPSQIAAEAGVLLVQAMSRHQLGKPAALVGQAATRRARR